MLLTKAIFWPSVRWYFIGVIFWLISSLWVRLRRNTWYLEKPKTFISKWVSNSFRDVANKKFYSAPKNAKFSIFGPRNMAMAGKKNSCFLARPENNFESKQTYFSYSPNKGFHPPEFQAKLFFTRNWVGGFYWDCLLTLGNRMKLNLTKTWEMVLHGRISKPPPPLVQGIERKSWLKLPGIIFQENPSDWTFMLTICYAKLVVVYTFYAFANILDSLKNNWQNYLIF